jgi:hypothetical protein
MHAPEESTEGSMPQTIIERILRLTAQHWGIPCLQIA